MLFLIQPLTSPQLFWKGDCWTNKDYDANRYQTLKAAIETACHIFNEKTLVIVQEHCPRAGKSLFVPLAFVTVQVEMLYQDSNNR